MQFYVHTDHLNTPRKVAQPTSGTLTWRWDADPFGTAAPNQNPAGLGTFRYNLRFPGQYYDAETGLSQNWNRDYDPVVGRYLESDPIGLKGRSYSPYVYVNNDPVRFTDPLGLFTLEGFPPDKAALMKTAVEEAEKKVRDCAGQPACFQDQGRQKIIAILESAEYVYDPQVEDCGDARRPFFRPWARVITIGPAAFNNWSACCDLESTLAHEANHLVDFFLRSEPSSRELEQVCFDCPRERQ